MTDYIERNALYEKTAELEDLASQMVEQTVTDGDLTEWRKWSAILAERSAFKFDVADAPAADVRPVVHGKWENQCPDLIPMGSLWYCSICDSEYEGGCRPPWRFCPYCGAKMDLEPEQEDLR